VAGLTYLGCGLIVWAVNEGLGRVCMRVFVAGKSCSWRGFCFGVGWRKISLSLDNHSHLNYQEKRECVCLNTPRPRRGHSIEISV
jgi:hypothetical protein